MLGSQPDTHALLRARAGVLRAVRAFFDARGLLEVQTPLMVPCPGIDVHIDAFEVVTGRQRRWLITSPELHMKRLLVAGSGPIYQLGKAFRREECGAQHEPEFTLLEWYRPQAGAAEVMADTEALVATLVRAAHGQASLPAAPELGRPRIDVSLPWPRMRVDAAVARYVGVPLADLLRDEEKFYLAWIERVEPALAQLSHPLFLTHWPASMAALARLHPEEPAFADRFEAYVGGMELCNGFGELTDPGEQRARFDTELARRHALGKAEYPVDERFLTALEQGMPRSGGNALGFDRLLMLLWGVPTIGEVMAFDFHRA